MGNFAIAVGAMMADVTLPMQCIRGNRTTDSSQQERRRGYAKFRKKKVSHGWMPTEIPGSGDYVPFSSLLGG